MPLSEHLEQFLNQSEILHPTIFQYVIITKEDGEILSHNILFGFKWRHVYEAIIKHTPSFLVIAAAVPRAFFDLIRDTTFIKHLVLLEYPNEVRRPHFFDMIKRSTSLEKLNIRVSYLETQQLDELNNVIHDSELGKSNHVEFLYSNSSSSQPTYDDKQKHALSEEAAVFIKHVNEAIQLIKVSESPSDQEIKNAMILDIFSALSQYRAYKSDGSYRYACSPSSRKELSRDLDPYISYIAALTLFVNVILNVSESKSPFYYNSDITENYSRERFHYEYRMRTVTSMQDSQAFEMLNPLLLALNIPFEHVLNAHVHPVLTIIGNEVKRRFTIEILSTVCKDFHITAPLVIQQEENISDHYTFSRYPYPVTAVQPNSVSATPSKKIPFTLQVSMNDIQAFQQAIHDYQYRVVTSPQIIKEQLKHTQQAIEKNTQLAGCHLSPEDHAFLMDEIAKKQAEEAQWLECLEIDKNPLYANYYRTFKTHFLSLMMAALLLESNMLDMNSGNMATAFNTSITPLIQTLAPRIAVVSKLVGYALQQVENQIRQAKLEHLKTKTVTVEAAEILGEKIARLLIRAYYHLNHLTVTIPKKPDSLIEQQLEQILNAFLTNHNQWLLDDMAQYLAEAAWGLEQPFNIAPLPVTAPVSLWSNFFTSQDKQALDEINSRHAKIEQDLNNLPEHTKNRYPQTQNNKINTVPKKADLGKTIAHVTEGISEAEQRLMYIQEQTREVLAKSEYDLRDPSYLLKNALLEGVNNYLKQNSFVSHSQKQQCQQLRYISGCTLSEQLHYLVERFNSHSSNEPMHSNALDTCIVNALSKSFKYALISKDMTLSQEDIEAIKRPSRLSQFFMSSSIIEKNCIHREQYRKYFEQWQKTLDPNHYILVKKT